MSVPHRPNPPPRAVLVTGAGGYIGGLLTRALASERREIQTIVATDVREIPPREREEGVRYLKLDVRSADLGRVLAAHAIDTVVHLASIVTPPKGSTPQLQYQVDVEGTRNVIEACVSSGVRKLIVTSSCAAYGYHPDNEPLLTEDSPLRGNESFPYAHHKRLVEEMLAQARAHHPELKQLVFRPGTILGESVRNQITDLFEKPAVLGLRETATPFNFVWDADVVACLLQGVHGDGTGTFNLVGDGVLTLREIASILRKPFVPISERLLAGALGVLGRVGVTQYGPEQVAFLRYRPVASNEKLKREFGYRPRMSTREVFDLYREGVSRRGTRKAPQPKVPVVVVTGAAGGIGRAIAERYIAEGAKVALCDIDPRAAERTARALRGRGGDAVAIACDVTDPAACERAVAAVTERWGGIDLLVNNAGISHRSLLAETGVEVIRKVMDVNFFGAVNITRAALSSIVERQGSIVAISSVAGFAPLTGRTGYAASKHALHGFFDSLRAELAPQGVHVLLVCPSFIGGTGIDQAALTRTSHAAPKPTVGRPSTPEDVAEALVRGVRHRRRIVTVSSVARASYWMSRLAPSLYERLMRRSVAGEFRAS